MQTTDFIWFDGKMVPWADAQVHVLTHALHYGSAVFEGIRAYACADGTSAVFRLKEHSQRLLNSAKILRLNIPYTVDEISQGILDTLKANKMKEGYIRPLSFVGDGEMGVYPGNNKVHTIIAVWPWGAYLGPEALEMGIRAKTSSFARMHVNTLMSKAVTRSAARKRAGPSGPNFSSRAFSRAASAARTEEGRSSWQVGALAPARMPSGPQSTASVCVPPASIPRNICAVMLPPQASLPEMFVCWVVNFRPATDKQGPAPALTAGVPAARPDRPEADEAADGERP